MRQPDKVIKVSLAEVKTAAKPHILLTPCVGSCVIVMLYDASRGIGSMAHIMLPDINLSKARKNRAKFANTAVEIMLNEMIAIGAARKRIKARIAGGANMFTAINRNNPMNMGKRNITAVKEELKSRRIRLVAEDTGGDYARSIEFLLEKGLVRVKSPLHGNKEI